MKKTYEINGIPDELKELPAWLVWCFAWDPRKQKNAKRPTTLIGDPDTGNFSYAKWLRLRPLDEVIRFLTTKPNWETGFSFHFIRSWPITGIDLDDCRIVQTGEPGAFPGDVVEFIGSYTEISESVHAPNSGKPLHIDIGGEGRYPGAANVNPNDVTSTTGAPGRPIPNYVPGVGEALPYGNAVADRISLEISPIWRQTAAEVARVIKPGGLISLVNPADYATVHHQWVIDAIGGTVIQTTKNDITTTTITVPRR